MREDLRNLIRELSKNDKKDLTGRTLKTADEVGTLASRTLSYMGAFATTHRFPDEAAIVEEVADVTLCLLSILDHLGVEDEVFEEMLHRKALYWAELQQRENDANYPVPYEVHVTVGTADIEGFRHACMDLGVKPIILDLQDSHGEAVLRDVMTSSTFLGDNPKVRDEMTRISTGLRDRGFEVVRQKIETVPWHPMAPSDTHQNPVMPSGCYFETHFGVLCTEIRRDELRALAGRIGAHLSRNIFKRISVEEFKIMLTARVYEGTRENFQDVVKMMQKCIEDAGFQLDKVIVEFSMYDSRIHHDARWIGGQG